MNCLATSCVRAPAGALSSVRPRGISAALPVRAARSRVSITTRAMQGGDKKKITRENEADDAWLSKGEREGENPLSDPVAIIGIVSILFPFIFLLIGAATGMIDLSMKV